jgi:O-antigen ligase
MGETNSTHSSFVSLETVAVADRASLPSGLLFAMLLVVPMATTALFGAVDSATWVLICIAWAFILLLWVAESWRAGGVPIGTGAIQIPLFGFILVGLVQLLPIGGSAISVDPYATRFFVIKLIVYATYLSACLAFLSTARRINIAAAATVIFGSGMALYGILQRLASPEGIYGLRETSGAIPFGPFVNQHHFATFMQMTGGLALGLLLAKESSRERRILLAAAVVIMAVATAATSSRGGLLGFFAAASFTLFFSLYTGKREGKSSGIQQKLILAGGILAIAIIVLGTVVFIGGGDALLRGTGLALTETDFSTGRLHFWPIALRIFVDHPIIGSGFESFGAAFTRYDTWSGQFRVEQAHNDYLQTLADSGVIGFLLLAAFIFLLFRGGMKIVAKASGLRREIAIGALAGCVGVMVHSFFDFPLRTCSNAFFFLLLCGLATLPVGLEPVTAAKSRRRRRDH